MRESVRPFVPVDGAARPPPDLYGLFYPTFCFVGLGCNDFALIPVHDVVISSAMSEQKKIRVIYSMKTK